LDRRAAHRFLCRGDLGAASVMNSTMRSLIAAAIGPAAVAAGWLMRGGPSPSQPPGEALAPSGDSPSTPEATENQSRADPMLAERLRRALRALYGLAAPDAAPLDALDAAKDADSTAGPGTHMRADPTFEQQLADFVPLARSCYQAALARRPDLAGRVEIDVVILGDVGTGAVDRVAVDADASTLHDAAMEVCLEESMMAMMSMPFVAPVDGGVLAVVYPLDFDRSDVRPSP
jgi:hypothetical protein